MVKIFYSNTLKRGTSTFPCLRSRQNTIIPLATGGETQTVCSVLIKDKTQIPPLSVCFVPVDIVNCQNLAANGYMEGTCSETSTDQVTVVPGIVNPHQEETGIAIMNKSDDSITLNPGAVVATCSSSYEAIEEHHDIGMAECVSMEENTEHSEMKCTDVPSHLQEMFIKSSEHLNQEEKEPFAGLLTQYENVFLKSSDDLGLADRVRHKISTGSAPPIK